MKILAIDTSTKYLSLAIAEKDKILVSFHRDLERQHCAQLIPQIDKLLKKAKLKLKDISFIAFSVGPGSFTGLRIGAAAVKGFALARKIRVVGVPTLDVLAYNIPPHQCIDVGVVVPVIDAKRGNVYASVYSLSGGRLKRHIKYSVFPVSELLKKVKGDAIFLGDGLIPYKKIIEDDFKFKAEFAAEKNWYPRAVTVAKLGYGLIKKRKFEELDKFVPMYLYPRDVQVRGKIR